MICQVLPSVLLRLYSEERVLGIILDFCFALKSDEYPSNIKQTLRMVFELCERMRDSQRLSSLMASGQIVMARIQQRPMVSEEDRAVACCLLSAVSPYEDIANRFYVYLAALTSTIPIDESYEFLMRKALDECSPSSG
ncbi:unnamed protein product [Haemonchus placei]|uniref:Uncharacterized protein n=1 Tax=Haemonchus placei TaxID=6290 RepID=A0A3P7U0Y5_HAEPC|nr:unnamed protein product [Haemonchus placei]